MTDETPASPGNSGSSADEPVTAAPVEEPTGPAPGAEAPAEAAASDAAPAPAAEAPTEPAAAEPATQVAEAPAAAAAAASEPGAPVPPVAVPVTPEPSERGRGVFVPAWVAAVVAVLVVAGLGFLVGWIAAPDDTSTTNASSSQPAPNSEQTPAFPNLPGNGTGNGNNGNGSGGSSNGGSSDDDGQTVPSQSGAFMGISVESATDGGTGARINSVQADSPAAKAGLKEGDVITKVDGETVESSLDVIRAVRSSDPGDTLTVTYTRNGDTAEAKVTLGDTSSNRSSN